MKNVICMGSINMDMVMFVSRLPRKGETVITENFETHSGGKAANQAVIVSALGGNAKFLGKLGDDVFSQQLVASLRDAKVDTDGILIDVNGTAGIAMIRVDN